MGSWVHGLKGKESVAIKSALDRVLSGLTSEPPDLRIERRLGETPIKKQIEFERRLIGEKLKRSVLIKAEETLRNQKKLFLKSGLSQFLLTKSIFDVGRSAVQGDWHSFGIGIGFLTYGGLIAPRLESWINETLPLKLKKMKSRFLKSTDALNGFDQMLKLGKKTQLAYRALAGGVSNVLDIIRFRSGN